MTYSAWWIMNMGLPRFNLWGYPVGDDACDDDELIDEDPKDDDGAAQDPNEDPPKCEDCNGKGFIVLFQSRVECDTCLGSGY